MLHLNGYDKAHAQLIHLYAQHGIDYDQSIKPPRKEKNDKATKSLPCPQGCGRSFTAQGYVRMHLLKCKNRSVPNVACTQGSSTTAPPHSTTNQDSTTHCSPLTTLVIDNVFRGEQRDEGDFNAAANVAREMLDDVGRAHLEKKGKQRVYKPVGPKLKVPEPASCRSNTKRSHNAEGSNHEFDISPSKRHKSGSKREKRRALEASPNPSRARKVEQRNLQAHPQRIPRPQRLSLLRLQLRHNASRTFHPPLLPP